MKLVLLFMTIVFDKVMKIMKKMNRPKKSGSMRCFSGRWQTSWVRESSPRIDLDCSRLMRGSAANVSSNSWIMEDFCSIRRKQDGSNQQGKILHLTLALKSFPSLLLQLYLNLKQNLLYYDSRSDCKTGSCTWRVYFCSRSPSSSRIISRRTRLLWKRLLWGYKGICLLEITFMRISTKRYEKRLTYLRNHLLCFYRNTFIESSRSFVVSSYW